MKLTKYVLSASILTASVSGVSTISHAATQATTQTGTITKPVTVHKTADVKGTSVGTLKKGATVPVYNTNKNGWVKIDFNGSTAYIYKDFVTVAKTATATKPSTDTTIKTTTSYVKKNVTVRQKANATSKQLGTLKKGTTLKVISTDSYGWVKIVYKNTTAYVYKDFVTATKPVITTNKPSTTISVNKAKGFAYDGTKTYTVKENGKTASLTTKNKKNANGFKIWTKQFGSGAKAKKETVYVKEVANKGLYYKDGSAATIKLLPYPFSKNQTFKNGSTVYTVTETNTTVQTEAGTFKNVVAVKAKNETFYIAPGNGVVKKTKGTKTTFEVTAIK